MFTCLEDWIGVNGCSGATSASGVYINDLYGIELRNIDEIANEQQVNFSGVWDEVQTRALNRFQTDIISYLSKKYRLRMITQTVEIGKEIDTVHTTSSATQQRGFTVELIYPSTNWYQPSNMQSISVQKMLLYLSAPANLNVKIYDLDLGTTLYTHALTGVAGWNEWTVNETFTANRLFFAYDATSVTSVKTDLTQYQAYDWFCNCSGLIKGAYSTNAAPTTLVGNNTLNSYGLNAIFSVKCTYDKLVCNNKELFTQALLYCLGIELMNETIYSPRMNRWTTTDKNRAIALRQEYEAKYKGGTIEMNGFQSNIAGELSTVLDSIQLNKEDCCLECNQNLMFKDAYL